MTHAFVFESSLTSGNYFDLIFHRFSHNSEKRVQKASEYVREKKNAFSEKSRHVYNILKADTLPDLADSTARPAGRVCRSRAEPQQVTPRRLSVQFAALHAPAPRINAHSPGCVNLRPSQYLYVCHSLTQSI